MWLVRVDDRKAILVIVLQEERADVAAHDLRVVQCQFRVDDITPDHLVGLGEIVLIMAVCAPKRDDCGYSIAATTCTACPLLIVSTPRRHVSQGHA